MSSLAGLESSPNPLISRASSILGRAYDSIEELVVADLKTVRDQLRDERHPPRGSGVVRIGTVMKVGAARMNAQYGPADITSVMMRLRLYDRGSGVSDVRLPVLDRWVSAEESPPRAAASEFSMVRVRTGRLLRSIDRFMGPRGTSGWARKMVLWASEAASAVSHARTRLLSDLADPNSEVPSGAEALRAALEPVAAGPVRRLRTELLTENLNPNDGVYELTWKGCGFMLPVSIPESYLWGALHKAMSGIEQLEGLQGRSRPRVDAVELSGLMLDTAKYLTRTAQLFSEQGAETTWSP